MVFLLKDKKVLDDIDKAIIAAMAENARISFTEIGDKIGLSHVSIRERFLKLIKSGAIKTVAAINPETLGIELSYILIKTDGITTTRKIVEKYKNCPRILKISTVMGEYDIVALVYGEDKRQLEITLGNCIMKESKGIKQKSVLTIGQHVEPHFVHIRPVDELENEGKLCKMDCEHCEEYLHGACYGCPASKIYRGPFKFTIKIDNKR